MNIVCYSHYFVPEIGAPSARIYDLSQQWLTMGHHVQVITCFPNHPVGKLYPGYSRGLHLKEKLDGIHVHRHWTYITPNKGFLRKMLGHISYLPSAMVFSNPHVSKPDIAIGTSPTFFAAMAAAWKGVRGKIPFIMEVRDLWPAIFVELGVLRNQHLIAMLEKWEIALYRQATRVVTVTEAFRRNLIERGVPENKVVTIRNGADVEFWKDRKPSKSLQRKLAIEGRFVVLYIGAHGISHALGRILDAAEYLREFPDIRFLFVGEGAEKAQLVKKAEDLGLRNVRFLDPVDKEGVREFYALSDVCLVPLRDIPLFETFIPSKMFEIMAMGRPIIGSVRGESANILEQSGSALVVPPEDSKAIAESVLALYNNRDRAQEMGNKGREFVVANYSRHSLAASYLEVMESAISEYRELA